MATPGWRLTLDEPVVECIEPGAQRAFHSADMHEADSIPAGCWREPLTGAISKRPSFLTKDWYTDANWKTVTDWAVSSEWWESVYRGNGDLASSTSRMFGSVLSPDYASAYPISDATMLTIIAAETAPLFQASLQDKFVPSAKSNFTLGRDEGFVWHVRYEAEELNRFGNLLYLQWADVALRFSSDGVVAAYTYPSGIASAPALFEQVKIGQTNNVHGKDLYYIVLPIPGHGLAVHVSTSPGEVKSYFSAAGASSNNGHLFKIPPKTDGSGRFFVHDGGNLYVWTLPIDALSGISPLRYLFGYHAISYSTRDQTFVSPIFDAGYIPTVAPDLIRAIQVPASVGGTAGAALKKVDSASAWAAGTAESRRARIALTLSSSDARYTPWVLGGEVRFTKIAATRGTTAREITNWQNIEFTLDETGKIEGKCDAIADTPELFHIFRRGDAPWRLEHCADTSAETPVWNTIGGGLAKFHSGRYYCDGDVDSATARGRIAGIWMLQGKEARLSEIHAFLQTAFDGENLGDAINNVLLSAGEPPIASIPAELSAITLPGIQAGQNFRFGVQPGQGGEETLQSFLLLARGQYREFRLRYNWNASEWLIERKPRLLDAGHSYVLTPFTSEVGVASGGIDGARVLRIGYPEQAGQMMIYPPEANVVQAIGATSPGPGGQAVVGYPFQSLESKTDPDSLNYLGRIVAARPRVDELADEHGADVMSRRIFDIVSVREEEQLVTRRGFVPEFVPCGSGAANVGPMRTLLRAVGTDGARLTLMTGWLKRVHVAIEAGLCGSEECAYTISSRWEGGLHE